MSCPTGKMMVMGTIFQTATSSSSLLLTTTICGQPSPHHPMIPTHRVLAACQKHKVRMGREDSGQGLIQTIQYPFPFIEISL